MTTNETTIATTSGPTMRLRWTMYRRGVRMARRFQQRGAAGWPLPVEADAVMRAAMDWAKPFLHRI
jgi:hypothetical protein